MQLQATMSRDRAKLRAGEPGSLIAETGEWSFGNSTGRGGLTILRNGQPAGNGSAVLLMVANQRIYACNKAEEWYVWADSRWAQATKPHRQSLRLPNKWLLSVTLLAFAVLIIALAGAKILPAGAMYVSAILWFVAVLRALHNPAR